MTIPQKGYAIILTSLAYLFSSLINKAIRCRCVYAEPNCSRGNARAYARAKKPLMSLCQRTGNKLHQEGNSTVLLCLSAHEWKRK